MNGAFSWAEAVAFHPVSGLLYVFYFAIVIAGLRQWVIKARAKSEGIFSGTPLKEVTV